MKIYTTFIFVLLSIAAFTQQKDSLLKAKLDSLRKANPEAAKSKDTIFSVIQIPAEFPGGIKAWQDYLLKNIDKQLGNKYIKIPEGETSATQSLYVIFSIDTSGKVINVSVENEAALHPKLVKDAIRVIEHSPKWLPAQQEMFYETKNSIPIKQQIEERQKNGPPFKKVVYKNRQGLTYVAVK